MGAFIGMVIATPSIQFDAHRWARTHDGRGTIGVMVMTAAAAVAADDDSPARVMVSAIGSIAHGQVGRTTYRRVGDDGFRDDRIALDRVCRRRLAFSAMTGGRS